ncbi:RagB/SusD family nutrient uptake outer membrane protein [Sphingobacterium gobiense]|uniref:RagB/SusD family nutrient uptake outer membrane protein n=1 Tax=Sphingobacterium gobiense TaxID=1382456 RepID=A0A2S9JGF3_9SPHI|nr:RagB/SusD family nutrient uptake outer membrane protein [Sphingobacterium gobiense]PRD52023.1 RagB/SusD family nutrient uptake outer membrane protein [Sphingobacterium gobiense]
MKLIKTALLFFCIFSFTACDKYLDLVPTGAQLISTTQDYYELVSVPGRGYPVNNFQYLVDDQWMRESFVIGAAPNINTINFLFQENEDRISRINSSSMYNQTYKYIGQWNTIISLVDGSTGDADLKRLAKAEAKIFRAHDHFLLVNVYAKAYDPNTAATDGGICIMDEFNLEAVPTKSTVQQVYDFIQKDIDEALPYLQETPGNVYHPSLAFAWAFKAKVHLFKREIAEAKAAAEKALTYNDALFDLVAYAALGGPSAMDVPASANPEVLSYMYMTGYNEMNWAWQYIISPELVEMYQTADDKRFTLFFNTTNNSLQDAAAGTAYYDVPYTKFFYPTVGMKTPETYLMLAECYAREDNNEKAMEVLNRLRKTRIAGEEAMLNTPATRKETMELIINERRKELPFGYHRFFDLKRFNLEPDYAKTLVRTFPLVSEAVPQQTYTLAPDSRMYNIPFPRDVMELNPNIRPNTNEVLPF